MNKFANIEQFLIASEKRAFVMARVATRDTDTALDIVQDAMIKLVTKYSHKQSHEWAPLFYRILQSRINDWHRRQKVRNRWRKFLGQNDADDEFQDSSLENHSLEEDKRPEDDISSLEFSKSLEIAVSNLAQRQQQAFMLRAWEEYSTLETSEIMNCSQGSVKTHYSRALATIRKNLKEFSL